MSVGKVQNSINMALKRANSTGHSTLVLLKKKKGVAINSNSMYTVIRKLSSIVCSCHFVFSLCHRTKKFPPQTDNKLKQGGFCARPFVKKFNKTVMVLNLISIFVVQLSNEI